MTVAVLGGGPAGLYAALLSARRGIPVRLFERENHLGGLAAGRVVDGQNVDHGSHRLHPSTDPSILEDLRQLLGTSLQTRDRNGRIHLQGRWLSFPLSVTELASSLPPALLLRLAGGAAAAMLRRPPRDASFADVVTTGLGRPMGEMFYFPYARKIWGASPEELSGEQARRRIAADTPTKLLRKALSSSTGRHFYYPSGGFGAIPDSLASAAAEAGAVLEVGTSVVGLRPQPDGWVIATAEGEHRARLVLSTIPLTTLLRLLESPLGGIVSSLRSRAMTLVYLTVDSPRWTPYDAHYFPSMEVPFTRISEPKNYRSSPLDPPDRTVLCVEMPCDVGDDVWRAADAELARSVREAIRRLGLPDPGERATVVRLPHAYPVYERKTHEALGSAFDWLEGFSGLVTFGRQGLFAHDNTHHALAMARDAVACVSDDLQFDRVEWAAARNRFALHVVED